MAASSALLNALAAETSSLITHVGLVDGSGTELTGGSYARQTATFTATGAEAILSADRTFDIPASSTVAGWRAFSALTGGTNYGGEDLENEVYTGAGQYVLKATDTKVVISAAD